MAYDKNTGYYTNINFRVMLRLRHKAKEARRKGYHYTDSENVNFGKNLKVADSISAKGLNVSSDIE